MSTYFPRYPPLTFVGPYSRLLENQPPRPWSKHDPLPQLADIDTFKRIHRQRDDKLKWYIQRGRSDWQSMPYAVWEDLLNRNSCCLAACNAEGRIAVAERALAELATRQIAYRGPLHFITFAPKTCVVPIEIARRFDVRTLTALVRQALGDVNLIGFVEAALYLGWGPDGPAPHQRFVSWHVHFITWGADREVLDQRLKGLRERHENMVGRSPVWVQSIQPHQIEVKLIYMAKGQLKEYRINAALGEELDQATGVITRNTRQQKRWMRTGEHVRMCNVMRDLQIVDLLFGNGVQGSWLARKVRYESRGPFCACACVHAANSTAAAAGREEPYPIVAHNRALGLRLQRERWVWA